MTKEEPNAPPSYASVRQFEADPVIEDDTMLPSLDTVVRPLHCYMYLSLIERAWTLMDTLSEEQQRFYLARAEQRYEKYVRRYTIGMPTPPLDVAFVWHTHCLSPLRYMEDLVTRNDAARHMYNAPFPLDRIFSERHGPSKDTLQDWGKLFPDEPYTLDTTMLTDGSYTTACYRCGRDISLPWADYVPMRLGNMSVMFSHACKGTDQICLADMARYKLESDLTTKGPIGPPVSGTQLKPNGKFKTKGNKLIQHIKPLQRLDSAQELDYAYERVIEEQLKRLGKSYEHDANELLYAIRTCYQSNPSNFSLDLIHAVFRQRKFYDSVKGIQWEMPDNFSRAVRRYHDFLFMMRMNPQLVAVPTIEIDCAWHTHMLFAFNYTQFGYKYLNRAINHDDTIPETKLSEHARSTNSAWQKFPLRYRIMRPREREDGMMVGQLTPLWATFGRDYYAGKIVFEDQIASSLARELNSQTSNDFEKGIAAIKISTHSMNVAHAHGVDHEEKEQRQRDMQEFVARNMSDTSYGYIGTSNCGTGGKSAIYSSAKRSYAGNITSSAGGKLRQLLASDKKLQNRFSDAEGTFSYSPAFNEVPPPGYEPRLRRSRSNDDIYASNAAAATFLLYPPILFAPTYGFCGGISAFGAGGCGSGNCGAGAVGSCGGGGHCGGGGCGGGGCGGGGGGGCGGC
ncbi:hypothetical protein BC940DRAFT_348130 [Gongronella butleri]|nr:hypothetical protein BC940DRAFT_348130 [Gongronella butleri]